MNPDRLLAHFERLADTPDAIPRFRQFVLDLAVRGKLVEQDPNDEPASELLERIATKRERFVKAGVIKRPQPSAPIGDVELPIKVPRHWVWIRLRELGPLGGGMTPSMNRPEFWGGDIVWLSPKDMKTDELVRSELKITEGALRQTRLQIYPPGCLFMVARSGILKRIFPIAINRVPAAANQDMKVLTPFIRGQERFLQIMFRGLTDFILRRLVKTGTTVQSLKYAEFEEQPFPLPPLAEQQRIVAKVDELMALCDRLEAARNERESRRDRLVAASLHRLSQPADEDGTGTSRADARFYLNHLPRLTIRPEHVKQLRQTILNLAVRGRLVPQDPKDESAAKMLNRVAREISSYCSAHRVAHPRPDRVVHGDEPFAAPACWQWTRLAALFRVITDGDHQPPPRADEGVAFLTIGNITTGKLDFSGCRFVPEAYFRSLARYRTPARNDILYTVVGATYGRPALVETDQPFCVQRHIAILKPASEVNLRFLVYLLASPLVYEQASSSTTGTAQPTIALRPLRNFLVAVPPLAEQHRIVAKVDQLLALCDRLEASLAEIEADSRHLLEAVLHEALEPAETALEAAE